MGKQKMATAEKTFLDIFMGKIEAVGELAALKVDHGEMTEEEAFRLVRRYTEHLRNNITITVFDSEGKEHYCRTLKGGKANRPGRRYLLHRYLRKVATERKITMNSFEKISKAADLTVDALYDQIKVLSLFSKGVAAAQSAALAELGKDSLCPVDADLEVVATMAKTTHYLLQSLALLGDNGQGPTTKKSMEE